MNEDQIRSLFGQAQLEAYQNASHGYFFWNWIDGNGTEWDWNKSYAAGYLSGKARPLPFWSGAGVDPLEEELDPGPEEPRIHFGDEIFLRTFQGYYVEVEESGALARWCDKGTWQCLKLCPAADEPDSKNPCQVRNGDVVRFRAHTDCFLGLRGKVERHRRLWAPKVPCSKAGKLATEFVMHVEGKDAVKHRSAVWLECRSSGHMLDSDGEKLRARWNNKGSWQRFVLEKKPPKRRASPGKERKASPGKSQKASMQNDANQRVLLTSSPESPSPSLFEETPRTAKKRRASSPGNSSPSFLATPARPLIAIQSQLEETPCFRVVKKRRIVNHRDSLCSLDDCK
jgi:hypothetical protein